MSKLIPEYNLENEGTLVRKKNYNFKGKIFEFRVYSLNTRYIGRTYLDGKQHYSQDYVQNRDDAEIQQFDGVDICDRFFKAMEGDLKSNQNPRY